jgi:hypothetical protein
MKDCRKKAVLELGTVGSGNHYVDLMRDEAGMIRIGIHFGRRGLGHASATRYVRAAGGREGDARSARRGAQTCWNTMLILCGLCTACGRSPSQWPGLVRSIAEKIRILGRGPKPLLRSLHVLSAAGRPGTQKATGR